MHLVQLLLPITDNAGAPFPREHYRHVRDELTQRFGGVTTYTRAPAEGRWKDDSDAVARDEIVIFEVMTDALDSSWWAAYRRRLEATFAQDEIVVRALPMRRL